MTSVAVKFHAKKHRRVTGKYIPFVFKFNFKPDIDTMSLKNWIWDLWVEKSENHFDENFIKSLETY